MRKLEPIRHYDPYNPRSLISTPSNRKAKTAPSREKKFCEQNILWALAGAEGRRANDYFLRDLLGKCGFELTAEQVSTLLCDLEVRGLIRLSTVYERLMIAELL